MLGLEGALHESGERDSLHFKEERRQAEAYRLPHRSK